MRFVGVAWNGSNSDYSDFISRHGLTFANLDDTSGTIYRTYEVASQPAWVFVASNGSVTTKLGVISDAELESVVAGL